MTDKERTLWSPRLKTGLGMLLCSTAAFSPPWKTLLGDNARSSAKKRGGHRGRSRYLHASEKHSSPCGTFCITRRWTTPLLRRTTIIFTIFMTFLTGILISNAFAEIGRIETKRERMAKERQESPGKSDNDAYLKIHENFLRENYVEVDRLANGYLSDRRSKPNSEDVLYLQALSLLKLNRGDEARVKLKELENSFTAVDRKASASASIADSYFYEGKHALAYEAYQETLRKYPNSDQTAYALYKLKELSSPAPPLVQPQKQMSIEETPFFTVQVGAFSKIRNANALTNKLIHQHYEAYMDKDAQTNIYRVRVGRLSKKEEAFSLERRLKNEGYPTKIIP